MVCSSSYLFSPRMINMQGRLLSFTDVEENLDAHKLISFKLCMMIQRTKLQFYACIDDLDLLSRSQGPGESLNLCNSSVVK